MTVIRLTFFAILIFTLLKLNETATKVDASKSKVWGPGLKPTKIVFPARYFFVQLYNSDNNIVTDSSDGGLEVHISGDSQQRQCRVWSNILNRMDGSFIVRYKVYEPCSNMKIDLRYKNMPIGGFPMKFEDRVLSDNCNCPQPLNKWLDALECKKNYPQIDSDLKRFKVVDFKKVIEKISETFTNPGSVSLCHYVVKSNGVYRQCFGQYVGFHVFMDAILLSLTRKVPLPDFEMYVNLGDWPLAKESPDPLPIFSWCGSKQTVDIVMPTYELTEATLECMGRVQLDMLSVQGNTGPQWESKIGKGFWRGRDSTRERLDLIELSRQFPDYLNASLTDFFFFRDKADRYGPKVDRVSFFDFFQYKYQVTLDGTVAAYRLPFLLAGDSAVLKQNSPYYEHFYRELVEGDHYLPFKRDLSNLVDTLKFLTENDDVARNISLNARAFVMDNLMPEHIFCYHAVLYQEWSTKLLDPPQVLPGMERVPQPDSAACPCPLHDDRDEL